MGPINCLEMLINIYQSMLPNFQNKEDLELYNLYIAVCKTESLRIPEYQTGRGEFRPRQTRQLPRAVDLKGRLLSCQSY